MLVLTRKPNEAIRVGETIELTVLEVRGNRVRVGIEAPRDVHIARAEIWVSQDRISREDLEHALQSA